MEHRDIGAQVDAYIEQHWDEVVADIDALVRIESVEDLGAAASNAPFGPGPRAALSEALAMAERMGFTTHDCEGYLGFADFPGASDAQVGIIGHVDVVPAGPGWSFEPYAVTRKDGFLIGRGTADDKGPFVVAAHAMKFWKDAGARFPYTIRLLIGANEETNMGDVAYYRSRYADPAFLFTPDAEFPVGYGEAGICSGAFESAPVTDGEIADAAGGAAVNAVPGEAWALVRAHGRELRSTDAVRARDAGEGLVRIDAAGKSAHASTPEQGVNAIGLLAGYLLENGVGTPDERAFLELVLQLTSRSDGAGLGIAARDEHFGDLTAVGGMLSFSEGRLRQTVDCRYPTTTSAAAIAERLCERARAAGASFSLLHDKEPFLTDPASPAIQALVSAYNEVTGENARPFTMKGGTYARLFPRAASFGPDVPGFPKPSWVGGMHGPDEGISEELLRRAFKIYVLTIKNLMNLELV